jgi:hypothetical protein
MSWSPPARARWTSWDTTIYTDRLNETWAEWFVAYGIDPYDVCVPGWVEADDVQRTITYLAIVRDENGGITRERRVLQLEAPALPFPHLPAIVHEADVRGTW